ncbi:hypothetical protein WG906_01400 [Pedobacter sp. P351]|uniref:hypothetical protein n=1 Tax=Pedobacter superstes TaxID=3133441 RepID=UPI00309C2775
MNYKKQLTEGVKLVYVGKGFEQFHIDFPYMDFLGYDTQGWDDIWVAYRGRKLFISRQDVEILEVA